MRVSGLPFATKPDSVLAMFGSFGPTECVLATTEMGKDIGQALVSFPTVESAISATQQLNNTFFLNRRVSVSFDFKGPRIVHEQGPKEPHPRKLIKQVRDKALGAKYPLDPVMASTNESRMLRRYKTGGLPRSHDRQR